MKLESQKKLAQQQNVLRFCDEYARALASVQSGAHLMGTPFIRPKA